MNLSLSSEPIRLLLFLVGILSFVGLNAAYLVWVERKGAGRFQRRPGPTEVGPAGLLQPIADAIEARTGITPDAFALSVYDALFVVNLALVHGQPQKNFDNFKAAFVEEADHYRAITGSTALDAAGDRLNGDFDFWAVRLRNGNYTWVRVGTYNNGVLTVF